MTETMPTVLVLSENRLDRDLLAAALSRNFAVAKAMPAEPSHVELVAVFVQEVQAAARMVQDAKRALPLSLVVVAGGRFTEEETVSLIESGASACIGADASLTELVAALDAVRRGQTFCSPRIASMVFTRVAMLSNAKSPVRPPLTTREMEILQHLKAGLSNKDIAHDLSISTSTVKNHVHLVLSKLKVSRRADLIDWHSRLNVPIRSKVNGVGLTNNGHANGSTRIL